MKTGAAWLDTPAAAGLEILGSILWCLGIWAYTLVLVLELSLGGVLNPNGVAVYLMTAVGGVVGLAPPILLGFWKARDRKRDRKKADSTAGLSRLVFKVIMMLPIPVFLFCGVLLILGI